MFSSVDRDVVGPVETHPIFHDVIVEPVESLDHVACHVLRQVLEVVSDPLHLRPHVMKLQQRQRQVLPQPVRDLNLRLVVPWPEVRGQTIPRLDLGVDCFAEVESGRKKNIFKTQKHDCFLVFGGDAI